MPGCPGLTRRPFVLEFWCFVGSRKEAVDSPLPIRACSKVVLRSSRIAESGVRFSSGPQGYVKRRSCKRLFLFLDFIVLFWYLYMLTFNNL